MNPFGGLGGLVRLFSTHPPAEERIRRLQAMALAPRAPPRTPKVARARGLVRE